MTAACLQSCCSVAPRMSVAELFERGYLRSRTALSMSESNRIADADGNAVCFSIDARDGKIAAVSFRASTCATLIAYCEWIAETVPGFSLEIAAALTSRQLTEAVAGVPTLRQDRAVLAITAFRAALRSLGVLGANTPAPDRSG